MAGLLVLDAARVLRRYTFVLSSSPRPAVFLIGFIVPGIVYAWSRGERQAALLAAVLMLSVLAIDTIGVRRGLKDEYFLFTDPFVIAGTVLLDQIDALRFHRWAYPVGVILIALHVVVGQAELVKQVFAREGPEKSVNGSGSFCRCPGARASAWPLDPVRRTTPHQTMRISSVRKATGGKKFDQVNALVFGRRWG